MRQRRFFKKSRKPLWLLIAIILGLGVIAGLLLIVRAQTAFTFVKHYRIADWSAARGVAQTKDGGYVFVGQANYDKDGNLSDEDASITKVDAAGNLQWTKMWQSFHTIGIDKGIGGFAKKGDEAGREIVELTDGSFLMASQGTGFVDSNYLKRKEKWDDIWLTKFDARGNHLWSKMIGDYSKDRVYKVFSTKDGGFLFSGYFARTGFGDKTAPSDFVLIKFDKNGKQVWAQKMEMSNADITPLADNGFIAVGSIATAGKAGATEKFADEIVPVVFKINANWGVEWAKSLEIVPLEESIFTIGEDGHTKMHYQTKRSAVGKFFAVRPAADGYVILGFLSPLLTGGSVFSTPVGKSSLAAIKINNAGDLQWAKAIKLGMQFGGQFNDDVSETKIVSATDQGFILKMDYLPPPRSDQENRAEQVEEKLNQLNELCTSKNREEDCANGKIFNDPELLAAWENYIKTVKSFDTRLNNGVLLLKTDADFNPQWSKKISLEDYVYGYGVQATVDNGLIIGGSYNTSILSYSNSMGQGYFQDTLLIKLDANGTVASDSGMIVDYTDFSSKDVGSWLALKDIPPAIKSFSLKIDKKVQPKTPVFATKVRELAPAMVNNIVAANPAAVTPSSGITTPPQANTWAEINYAQAPATVEIKPIYKSAIEVNQEILPALKEIFANEVKLNNDVFFGLEYTFNRLVTANDKTTLQKYLEGQGYKTYLAEGDQLIMMKIGRTLTITFSFSDKTKGTIYITY